MREQIDSFLNYLAVERGLSSNTLDAYFNDLTGLIEFLEDSTAKGFIKVAHQKMLLVSDSSDELIHKIESSGEDKDQRDGQVQRIDPHVEAAVVAQVRLRLTVFFLVLGVGKFLRQVGAEMPQV